MFNKQTSIQTARSAAAQGMVLLKNEDNLLPLKKGSRITLAGEDVYYRGGGGSADVFCDYVITIGQGLKNKAEDGRIILCEDSDTVVTVFARNSGEEEDYYAAKGQYYPTDEEMAFFKELEQNKKIKNVVLLLNIPSVIDLSWVEKYTKIKAALIVWLPGMEGGNAVADVLCGDVTPSGHLTDTFAYDYYDYPSSLDFEKKQSAYPYEEDIFVGYRYFETFAPDRVLYPFGYGLSYTEFETECRFFSVKDDGVELSVCVKNIGNYNGAEVVQIYSSAPQGLLDHPAVELRTFAKTKVLAPNETQVLSFLIEKRELAAFDDTGITGCLGGYVLEKGDYAFYFGNNTRDRKICGTMHVEEDKILSKHSLKLTSPIDRRLSINKKYESAWIGEVETEKAVIKPKPDRLYTLQDVAEGGIDMYTFLAQLTDDELIELATAQPPAFPRGTAGIGNNKKYGIPNIQTADGPAGLRKTVPTVCFPCATLLSCTWDYNTVFSVGKCIGEEGIYFDIDVLLAPGLNIHRNPLCGRNFEYYSEDPLVSGKTAAAYVDGVQSTGMLCTIKHFTANNKEINRFHISSQVSERAMREIYLKGFEIAVKEANPGFIMTSYNLLNGTHTSAHHGLLTGIVRNEWGYKGAIMTDWRVPERQWREIKAGNNIKMPFGYPEEIRLAKEMLKKGRLERIELIANAEYVLNSVMRSERFRIGNMGLSFTVEDEIVLKGTVFTGVNSTTVGEMPSTDGEGYVLGDTWKDKNNNDVFVYYDLDVKDTGIYDLSCRIATPFDTTRLDIQIDEEEIVTGVKPLSANSWEDWHTLHLCLVSLTKGEHRLKFFIRDDEKQKGILLNWINIKKI